MSNKATFPDHLPPDELAFRSSSTETREYSRKLSEEEIAQLAEEMLANHDTISDMQEELREHSKQVREEVKALRQKNATMRSERKSGARLEHGPVHLVMDYDGRRVGEYNAQGTLIRVRSMREKEAQLRIDEEANKGVIEHPSSKTGTEG